MTLTDIVLRSGLVSSQALTELKTWGAPLPDDPEGVNLLDTSLERVCQGIDKVLSEAGYVLLPEEELDITTQFVQTVQVGTLELRVDGAEASHKVSYGRTTRGEIIFAWAREDSLEELLVNGASFLRTEQGLDIYFQSVRELFQGQRKSFAVARPS